MGKRAVVIAAALGLAMSSVSGCDASGGDNPRVIEPSVNLDAAVDNRAEVVFPLDAYEISDDQQRLVTTAYDTLMSRCLKRFGYDIPVGEPMGKPHRGVDIRFGLIDEEVAKVHGYRGKPNPKPLLGTYQTRVPHDIKWLLLGDGPNTLAGQEVPEGGCQGEALRAIQAANIELRNVAEDLILEAIHRTSNDSRVQKYFADWSKCMRDAGYQYGTPADAETHWSQTRQGNFAAATAQELADAVANVRCKKSTGLLRVWMAVNVGYENQLVAENEVRLAEVRKSSEAAVKSATQVVAGN